MITVTINLSITGGTAPFKYWVTHTCPDAVVITNPTGTSTTDTIDVTVQFPNTTVLTNCANLFTLRVEDALGCIGEWSIGFHNPCVDFSLGTVQNSAPYTYWVSPTGNNGPVTYSWSIPSFMEFLNSTSTDDVIHLKIKDNYSPPAGGISGTITVFGTDEVGCTATATTVVSVCKPTAFEQEYSAYCTGNGEDPFYIVEWLPI